MKPFDLEKAKAGAPVITRDGREARIICFDAKQEDPLIVLVTNKSGFENDYSYLENGRYQITKENPLDLFMKPIKRTYYFNVFKHQSGVIYAGHTRNSLNEAIACAKGVEAELIKTVSIEIEE